MKKTKIVATLGPATESEEMLEKMIKAGMNVARFNCKHADPSWHINVIKRVKKVSEKLNIPVAILVDLQGPEVRINIKDGGSLDVKKDELIVFAPDGSDFVHESYKTAYIPESVINDLSEKDKISIDDGYCKLEVVEKKDNKLVVKVLNDHVIKHRKTLNTPGVRLNMPSLIQRDYDLLDALSDGMADYIALSFVRDKNDILFLRDELEKRGLSDVKIMAKIENQSAVDHLDEIIETADAFMVARGDLGVEVPYEQLIFWQKTIIQKAIEVAKPVIVATQMLETMINNPTPTRAEISDIAHAIYDRTDAIMLSGETTVGKYPLDCIKIQAKVAEFNEQYVEPDFSILLNDDRNLDIVDAGLYLIDMGAVDEVVVFTETGKTAQRILSARPSIPVHVITTKKSTYTRMALVYGAIPHLLELDIEKLNHARDIVEELSKYNFLQKGKRVLIIHGHQYKKPGLTDTISLITV